MVADLLQNYVFMLLPCFKKGFPHKDCEQCPRQRFWFEGDPSLSILPLPVQDANRPWGGSCKTCASFSTGHYLSTEKVVEVVKKHGIESCAEPPSVVIKGYVQRNPSEFEIELLAKKCLLSVSDTSHLMEHYRAIEQRKILRKANKIRTQKENKGSGKQTILKLDTCNHMHFGATRTIL